MSNKRDASDLANAPRLLDRKVRLAQAMIMFERIWRALLWPFCVLASFTLMTLAEIWHLLGAFAHTVGLAGFGAALLASLVPLARVTWPGREDGLRRLEQVSGIKHRPATSFDDELAGAASEEQRMLWDEHRQRIAGLISRLTAGWPHPRLARADPYALRAALLLMLCVGFLAAGDTTWQRFASAFDITPSDSVSRFRIDAWVTPPVYTAKPPMVLADGDNTQNIRQITTPAKSLLLVRVNGPASIRPDVQIKGEGILLSKKVEPTSSEDSFAEYKITIDRKMTVNVGSIGFARATWHFDIIKDSAPIIELTRKPSRAPRGAVRFTFRVKDDYGVASAEARFALAGKVAGPGNAKAANTKSGKISEQLLQDMDNSVLQAFKVPHMALTLPRANARIGEARAYKDLTSHPWAGLKVIMTLKARDQAGQEGASKPYEFVLPARKFTKPMAKAIIEQRKILVRKPGERNPVQRALTALTIAPERFMKDTTLYLALRSVYWRLHYDESPEGLKSVVDQLWDLALRIEDGDLPQAEADLKAAQDALRKALEEGASEAEISKLMAQLRAALDKFLQAMAEKARQNGNLAKMPEGFGPQQTLSSKDIEEMLRDIENLARTGSRQLAQQLLDKLSGMMQRLQMGQSNPNSQSRQMMDLVRGLGELIQRQQKLLDETFKERRKLNDPKREESPEGSMLSERRRAERNARRGRQGMQGQQGPMGRGRFGEGEGRQRGRGQGQGQVEGQAEGMAKGKGKGSGQRRYGGLANRQGSIRDRLDGLLEQLRTLGTRPPEQFEGAGRAMREAEKALGESNLGRATQQQTLALDRLRQGAQSVAEQVLQTLSSRVGQGGRGNRDPLGRPERTQGPDLGTSVRVPDQIDIQRAREILDELRKRLGEPSRPMLELDYLERLIQKF